MGDYMQMHAILYKGLEHLWILVTARVLGPISPRHQQD